MIEFRGVTKKFPDGTLAVKDFSLVLPSRKTTVLVGSSGSGKTTLLRMINRMAGSPSSGSSILITSAPMSAKNIEQNGPERMRVSRAGRPDWASAAAARPTLVAS